MVLRAWQSFQGVHRRFELHGEARGVRVYDDYAHHPTEVAAALTAARVAAGDGRLIAVFQPGTYSRTQTFADEFAEAMAIADIAVVLDIFPAREEPIPGVTGALIAERIPLPPERVIYEDRFGAVPKRIAEVARPGRSRADDGYRHGLPALPRNPGGDRGRWIAHLMAGVRLGTRPAFQRDRDWRPATGTALDRSLALLGPPRGRSRGTRHGPVGGGVESAVRRCGRSACAGRCTT